MTSLSRSCATSRLEPWTDTHTQDNYSNPRACAPRVNKYIYHKRSVTVQTWIYANPTHSMTIRIIMLDTRVNTQGQSKIHFQLSLDLSIAAGNVAE